METNKNSNPQQLTEHLFRNFYQEVFSSLVIKFGSEHIDLIEDALQETFYKALKTWQYGKLPSVPKNWLFAVTKNHLINELKRNSKTVSTAFSNFEKESTTTSNNHEAQLQLLLICSKLKIKERAKLIFTLKAICGFGITEISNGLQLSEENVYKHLQRVKRKLQLVPKAHFELLVHSNFTKVDIHYIEMVIYFIFNEGYDSVNNASKNAINRDICFEAVRLAHLLEKKEQQTSTKHLLALCYFHMARFDSRINDSGEFISLKKQDRTRWDQQMINIGLRYLKEPETLNRFYLEALIASIHLQAKSFIETNWKAILKLYDALLLLYNSDIIRLNRAICLFELNETKAAKEELLLIKDNLENNYLYYTMSMATYFEDKDVEISIFFYKKSLKNTKQDFRKQIIQRKLDKLV